MATAQPTRYEEYLIEQNPIKENAFNIIMKMLDLFNQTPGSKHLVDEVLHCLFFLGQVSNVRYTPEEIISDQEILENLKEKYPRPLQLFSTQLPKRSPFSCFMDMIVMRERPENEDKIKESLRDFAKELKEGILVSSTMCVSQPPNSASKYYGVSLSTVGPNPGIIVLAGACLTNNWDDYVAEAVMTYYPGKAKFFRADFDARMILPQNVRCQAFQLSNLNEMKPCKSCGELFGLLTDEKKGWPYGNCAEAESLSNLLKNEQDVKNQTTRVPTYKPENRQKVVESVLRELKVTLGKVQFKKWDNQFYTPQQS